MVPLWPRLKRLLLVDDSILQETFTLRDPGAPEVSREREAPEWDRDAPLSRSLDDNRRWLQAALRHPDNADVIFRDFKLATRPEIRATAVLLDGMVDKLVVNATILQPLMLLSRIESVRGDPWEVLRDHLLPSHQLTIAERRRKVLQGILSGDTAIFIDGYPRCLVLETKGFDRRPVQRPQTEMAVRGSQEGFTETLRTNTALVRRRLQTQQLVTEMVKVGRLSQADCAIMYVDGVVNPDLVDEVRRRVKDAQVVDYVGDSGMLELLIEDSPFSLVPTVLATERPDRVGAFLSEGHAAILANNSPFALVVPATFWAMLHSAEDYYLRWPYGTFLRLIRVVSWFTTLLLPGIYVAVTNYHPEMIPTDLLLSIASSRERVPFPLVGEVLLMEGAFELIREAGVRIPTVIGPTIGIVGAIILGQAAVAANIVSPLLVIAVAITGLASFAIPNQGLSLFVRVLRFGYLLLGAVVGLFGISLGLFVQAVAMSKIKSFGVPILAPLAPWIPRQGDLLTRPPAWAQELRPGYVDAVDDVRQPEIVRRWDPTATGSGARRAPKGGGRKR